MKLEEIIKEIKPLDESAMQSARMRQDTLTKPRGSLGRLEELSIQLAGMKANASAPAVTRTIPTMTRPAQTSRCQGFIVAPFLVPIAT